MFAAGCLPSLVDGEVTSPELDVFGMGEPRALMGCASFSLSFNFGSQYESPSLPHATLSFAVGEVLVALKLEAGRREDLRDLAVLAGTDLDGERVATPRDRSMTRATRHAALRRELPSTADPGRRDRTGGGRDKRSSASGDVPRRGPHPEGRTDEGRPGGDEGCRRDAAMTQGRPLKQPGTLRPRARTK